MGILLAFKSCVCFTDTDSCTHEFAILDEILSARKAAGLSQAQVAKRMGTQAPAIARLESALATGKHSPSLSTLRKYAAALGKRVELHLV